MRFELSCLRAMTGDALFDAGDKDVAADLRVSGVMAIAAIDRRVLGVVEAGRRQKAVEQHYRRDPELTAGRVGHMAVEAAALLVEDNPERVCGLLSDPGASAWRFAQWRCSARHPTFYLRHLRYRDTALDRDGCVETLELGCNSLVTAMRHFFPWQLAIELQRMTTLALSFVGDRQKTLSALLWYVTVGTYHRLIAERGKPFGDEMGGMREDEVGMVGGLGIVAEINPLDALLRRLSYKGCAELGVSIGETAHVAKSSLWRGCRECTVAFNTQRSFPDHQTMQTPMLLVTFRAARPL